VQRHAARVRQLPEREERVAVADREQQLVVEIEREDRPIAPSSRI
jgi:hypothetical protein